VAIFFSGLTPDFLLSTISLIVPLRWRGSGFQLNEIGFESIDEIYPLSIFGEGRAKRFLSQENLG
jgi:hypothetical protein